MQFLREKVRTEAIRKRFKFIGLIIWEGLEGGRRIDLARMRYLHRFKEKKTENGAKG